MKRWKRGLKIQGLLFAIVCGMLLFGMKADAATAKWVKKNNIYYAYSNGKLVRNKWVGDYYAGSTGTLVKNTWISGKYFVGENGKWIKNFKGGWYKINKKWYYYSPQGKKKTGWLKYKGNKYYLDSTGARVTKWQVIKSKAYYFNKSGKRLKSTWKKTGAWYYPTTSSGQLYKGERMNASTKAAATKIEYRTSSLTAIIHKTRKYGANCWIAQVKVSNPSKQIVGSLSYGSYGGIRETTSHAVKRNAAVVGINGSRFNYGDGIPGSDAVMIKSGKIYNYAHGTSYNLCLKYDGTLYTPEGGLSANSLVRSGVKDTYSFGPVLIAGGQVQSINRNLFSSPEMAGGAKYPRTAIGMVSPRNYILLVADGSGLGSGLSLGEMSQIFRSYGCTYAYNLDGGGSATMSYKGVTLNNANYGAGEERPCGDFMLFK